MTSNVKFVKGKNFVNGTLENAFITDNLSIAIKDEYTEGYYTTPIINVPQFKGLIASWNGTTEESSSLEVKIRIMISGEFSRWYSYGKWSKWYRSSEKNQKDDYGELFIDELVLNELANAFQIQVTLKRNSNKLMSPELHMLAVTFDDAKPQRHIADFDPIGVEVPSISQMLVPEIGKEICSPTSVTMLMNRYGSNVDELMSADESYDFGAEIYGNWSFNMAYAGEQGYEAYVEKCSSLRTIYDYLKRGIPVAASIKTTSENPIPGAPQGYPSGHLLVVKGFHVVSNQMFVQVNDPASKTLEEVERLYPIDAFEEAWSNVIYVITPKDGNMKYLEKAVKLHKENFVVDCHLDLGGYVYDYQKQGMTNVLETLFLDELKAGGFNLIIGAIYIEKEFVPELAIKIALKQIQGLKEEVRNSEHFTLITSKADLLELKDSDKIGVLMSLEGADALSTEVNFLDIYYDLGIRAMGLAWSRRNLVCDGSYFGSPEEGIIGGLTPFGIQVVRRSEELGIVLDISHLNDAGVEDLNKYGKTAYIASHSNCRSLNDIKRNITDEQIKTIGEKGGVIGINNYYKIVSGDEEKQTISMMVEHMKHMKALTSADNIGFGFDFVERYYAENKFMDVAVNHGQVPKFTAALLEAGFTEEECIKIIGGNFYEFFLNALK